MKKFRVYIIILVLGIAGWAGYNYFLTGNAQKYAKQTSLRSLSANSCWVYHEYVYRVSFRDQSLRPLLFIREADGTFSPSKADSSGNHIIGNGLIIDSTGSCVTTERITTPWELSAEEEIPLRDLVDEWLDMKEDLTAREYYITGQTVALFIVLNDPKQFIEYMVAAPVPGQSGYGLIYPYQKITMNGLAPVDFSSDTTGEGSSVFRILKTSFDENNTENPVVKTSIDSIIVTRNIDGYLSNIHVLKGDEFFYEGSVVFDEHGQCLGNLRYADKKWKLVPFLSFVQHSPIYTTSELQEEWEYDPREESWKKLR